MPARIIIPNGTRFGKLTVIRYIGSGARGASTFECLCDCGKTATAKISPLRQGRKISCGCLRGRVTHGKSHLPEYSIWDGMIQRVTNPKSPAYEHYGGRGIRADMRWRDFANFFSDMGSRPSIKHELERVNNDGNYEPGNCIWATRKQQNRNRRGNHLLTYEGRTMCVTDWAEETGIPRPTLYWRTKHGWTTERILTQITHKMRRH